MIGWRVGWVVGPRSIMADIALVGLTNVVCQVGIAQQAVAAALAAPDADHDVAAVTNTCHRRCELIIDQLANYPIIPPQGGWSLLIDTAPLLNAPVRTRTRRGYLHERMGPQRPPVPASGLRQRAPRTRHRPSQPLRGRLHLNRNHHGLQAHRRRTSPLAGSQRPAPGRPSPSRSGLPQRPAARTPHRHHTHEPDAESTKTEVA